jgi:hypothetical protein
MKIELIRGAQAQGHWMTTESMIADLQRKAVVLEPGDKLFVTDEKPRILSIGGSRHLRLVEGNG